MSVCVTLEGNEKKRLAYNKILLVRKNCWGEGFFLLMDLFWIQSPILKNEFYSAKRNGECAVSVIYFRLNLIHKKLI